MKNLKHDFPIFNTHPDLVYLDSGSTSQKPQAVIDAVSDFYKSKNANIHRGIYKLAEEATRAYENTRASVADFIGTDDPKEIVFTGNTNQAINIVAQGWAKKHLEPQDVIVLSDMEHHANIVPWLRLKEEIGVELLFLPLTKDYRLDYKVISKSNEAGASLQLASEHFGKRYGADYKSAPAKAVDLSKIKLISLTHVSNVIGTINPIEEIITFVKQQGIDAKILVDGAQSVPHMPVDVKKLGCDFLAFSGHKMLGPAGVGVLWGKKELLEAADPFLVGSNMIKTVTKEKATWADMPDKFEPGTGNLEGVAGLGAAIKYLKNIGMEEIYKHEQELTEYGLNKLNEISGLKLYGPSTPDNRLGIFSFGFPGVHGHDIAQILDSKHICVRSGHHCAQILMKVLGVAATARASVYLYNTKDDIDKLVEGLEIVKRTLKL